VLSRRYETPLNTSTSLSVIIRQTVGDVLTGNDPPLTATTMYCFRYACKSLASHFVAPHINSADFLASGLSYARSIAPRVPDGSV